MLAASFQKENLELTEVLGRILVLWLCGGKTMYKIHLSAHGSDTVTAWMDVTDLADPFGLTQRARHRHFMKKSNECACHTDLFSALSLSSLSVNISLSLSLSLSL